MSNIFNKLTLYYNNGAICEIPLHNIADNRAKYYAAIDKDTTYQEEYDYVMRDDHEGIDWFFSNMNWEDIAHVIVEVKPPNKFDPSDQELLQESRLTK